MIDRRLLTHFDWITLSVTAALALIGFMTVYSATHIHMPHVYRKEMYWFLIGGGVLFLTVVVNYSVLERFAYVIYGSTVLLLVSIFFVGSSFGGARRWIDLGVFSLQPSELAKIALIIILARYFSSKTMPQKGLGLKDLAVPGLLMAVPFLLIAKQPDLGTAIILWMIFWSMVLVVRVRTRLIVALIAVIGAVAPFGWKMLKGYQKARLTSFWNPTSDPLGSGYHVMQSKIAIGSGGFFGKGFTEGTQGKLMFLPEHHTDFIFSVLAEEWGFIGSMTVVALFAALVFSGLNTAAGSKDRFGFLLAFGASAMFFWHAVINLGMVSGMMPVVGVPLPFMSYGGSFLITCMIAAGILINVRMRRFIF